MKQTIFSIVTATLLSSSLFGAVTAEDGVDGYKYNTMLIDVISDKQGTVISDYATLSGSNWDFENYFDRIKGVDGTLDLQVTAKIEIPDDVTTDSVVIKVNKGCVRHNYNDYCAQIAKLKGLQKDQLLLFSLKSFYLSLFYRFSCITLILSQTL